MTETKKPTAKTAATEPVEPAPLARASESSDPAVHKLLGDHQTATLNGDVEAAERVEADLKKIGFTL